MRALNLASRPFRSERLPALLAGLGLVAMLILTVWHVQRVRELAATTVDRGELLERESDLRELYSREHRTRPDRPDAETLRRWAAIKELVDRRSFSWGALLSDLGGLLPPDVRLVSIVPSVEDGFTELELRAVARTRGGGYEFVRVLQDSGRFSRALPVSVAAQSAGEDFVYRMRYDAAADRSEGER